MTATQEPIRTQAIGKPLDRVDGPAKVAGGARYSAEIVVPGLTYAAIVGARIARGTVTRIDASAARAAEGVIDVLTHESLPPIAMVPRLGISLFGGPASGMSFFPMQDATIHYAGQPVAIVVAEQHEQAQYAASLVAVTYDEQPPLTTLAQASDGDFSEPETIFGGLMPARMERGDVDAGLASAAQRFDATYTMAANHHNPMEPHATVACWEGDHLTLYDANMGVRATQLTVAQILGHSPSKIRVVSHFVGGGFGSKALVWSHTTLAALAARAVGRPVKLVLTRPQLFTSNGHREEQRQRIELGADADGRLVALRHVKDAMASPWDDWAEPSTGASSSSYACPNYQSFFRLVHGNTMTATFTRGPGISTGSIATECALDEFASQLGIDPIELRVRNHTDVDAMTGHRWTSDGILECYARGAELFGWADRDPTPGIRRDGDWLIGTGMAAAVYPHANSPQRQRARARLFADGTAVVQLGTQEFGTGVATALTQVAADSLGLAVERVVVEIGDSDFPNVSSAVGSAGAAMMSNAVHAAASALRNQMVGWAVADEQSPLHGRDPREIEVSSGRMFARDDASVGDAYGALLARNHQADAETSGGWQPPPFDTPHGLMTFGAQFAEVAVDADLGLVRVRRLTGVFAPGRVLNRKLAHSQLMGGMLWGLSQALMEGNHMDPKTGRWAAESLGDYLVPVNADTPEVQVETVHVEDRLVNPLGVKGVGEIGQVGVAPAIANAVFHATGRRVREFPITVEQMLPSARV